MANTQKLPRSQRVTSIKSTVPQLISTDRSQVNKDLSQDPYFGYASLKDAVNDCYFTSQVEAFARLVAMQNVFISGPAGSGKSSVIEPYISWVEKNFQKSTISITATTGVAAANIGGKTIHSVARLMDEKKGTMAWAMKNVDILVIDEISMFPYYMFKKLDQRLRSVKKSGFPFGGVQLILLGDFQQLPPVRNSKDGLNPEDTAFVFGTEEWKKANIRSLYLDKVHRASDHEFSNMLGRIAAGRIKQEDLDKLNSRVIARSSLPSLLKKRPLMQMYPTNREIKKINETELAKISSVSYYFTTEVEKASGLTKEQEKDFERKTSQYTDGEVLELKVGAQVYMTKNKDVPDNRELRGHKLYPSGSIGEVKYIDEDETGIKVVVELQKDRKRFYFPYTWENLYHVPVEEDADPVYIGRVKSLPLKLAYATSVHKSQGQTYDGVVADLKTSFADGLGYVAVSRVRSIDDLFLLSEPQPHQFKMGQESLSVSEQVRQEAFLNRKEFIERREEYETLLTMPSGMYPSIFGDRKARKNGFNNYLKNAEELKLTKAYEEAPFNDSLEAVEYASKLPKDDKPFIPEDDQPNFG